MKLWEKPDSQLDPLVEQFTIGQDPKLDLALARYDVRASIAHARMLGDVGIITTDEAALLIAELERIGKRIDQGEFRIEDGIEDVHSQLEVELIRALGTVGEKIHTARSRNDQVLTALSLYVRDRLTSTISSTLQLLRVMLDWAQVHRGMLMPGMTHMQAAMPTTFALWMAAFAESLLEDIVFARPAFELANKNPLGTAAGYGSNFPICRKRTTALLGFAQTVASPAAAQFLRGKQERAVVSALAAQSATLGRLAMDIVLFLSPGYRLLRLPNWLSTGSSIMPHKQNPDVFELLRARFNRLQMLPNEIIAVTMNLPSGYHRDYQLLKEILLPAWDDFDQCTRVLAHVLPHLEAVEGSLQREEYRAIRSVERIHDRMCTTGESFRTAYRAVAEEIKHVTPEEVVDVPTYLATLEVEALAAIEQQIQNLDPTKPG
ncbi:MAG: argininosuccinate lyase [Chlorobi bacterium]|nr:argininosuccinate lyase [Chlorobiota bacterium]